jgi:hypothetical protein
MAGQTYSMAAGASQFAQELRLAAASNRNQAFNLPASVGFATPQSGPSPNLSFMNPGAASYNPGAFNPAVFNRGGGTQTTSSPFSIGQMGQMASGIGSFMSGYGRLFPTGG